LSFKKNHPSLSELRHPTVFPRFFHNAFACVEYTLQSGLARVVRRHLYRKPSSAGARTSGRLPTAGRSREPTSKPRPTRAELACQHPEGCPARLNGGQRVRRGSEHPTRRHPSPVGSRGGGGDRGSLPAPTESTRASAFFIEMRLTKTRATAPRQRPLSSRQASV